jgi:SAM-dependent methyltransferase
MDALVATSRRLNASVEALAALGAVLKLRRDGVSADPVVGRLLDEIVGALGPDLLTGLDPTQEATAVAFIETFFRQAGDLLARPERAPGWHHDDSAQLQSQGQASRIVVTTIAGIAAEQPALAEWLTRPGSFLDVGTGVGWLAIEAAKTWPALRVQGIDVWQPALTLAARNVAESSFRDRVAVRHQPVETLEDRDAYSLAWFPSPFIPPAIVPEALRRIWRAMTPGGWLVFGLYGAPPSGPLDQALADLRLVRGGGWPWRIDEVRSLLEGAGFVEARDWLRPPLRLVTARRPE